MLLDVSTAVVLVTFEIVKFFYLLVAPHFAAHSPHSWNLPPTARTLGILR